jgi:PST family polysaccharide transporter
MTAGPTQTLPSPTIAGEDPGPFPSDLLTADTSGLRDRAVRGTFWVLADQVLVQLVQIALYTVMAHLLSPAAFGVMAMAVVFTAFATLVGQLGLEAALVQARRLDDATVTAVFWLALVGNCVIGAVLAGLAEPIAAFYHQPALVTVILVVAAVPPVSALGSIPRALLTRRLEFRPVFVADAVALGIGAAVTITAALAGAGALSLAYGLASQTVAQSAGLWLRCRWLPVRHPDWHELRALWSYSGNLLGFNLVNYWARNADNLLIGRLLGPLALGFYERAYLLMLYPISQIMATLGRVMVSAMCRMGDDRARVGTAFLRSIGSLSLICTPLMFGLAVLAEPFVVTVFGEHWRPMIPVLRILALVAALQSVVAPVGFIYQSQGRTRLMFGVGSANAVVLLSAIVTGVLLGDITTVAACYAAAVVLIAVPTIVIPIRLLGLRLRQVVAAVGGSFAAAAAMAVVIGGTDLVVQDRLTEPVRLLIGVILGSATYLVTTKLLRLRAVGDLYALLEPYVRGWSQRWRRSAPATSR